MPASFAPGQVLLRNNSSQLPYTLKYKFHFLDDKNRLKIRLAKIWREIRQYDLIFTAKYFLVQKLSREKLSRAYTFANEQIVHYFARINFREWTIFKLFARVNFREWKICVFLFSLPIVLITGVDTKKHQFFVLRYTVNQWSHTHSSLRVIAIWQTVKSLATALASLRAITVKLSLVPIFKLFACINFREWPFSKKFVCITFANFINSRKFMRTKVSVRESLCS